MRSSFPGKVVADIIEIRFPFSGKVSAVNKHPGDKVKLWEWLAALDKKQLQTELDKELADYERARAHFDAASESQKQDLQLSLNVSVKNVELAKMRLDQTDLISPVGGLVVDNGGLRVGLNVTPAGNSIEVLDRDSLKFEFAISQNDLEKFLTPQKVLISFFKGAKDDVEAETIVPILGQSGKFKISAKLPNSDFILPGLEGEASI